jgi:hypothetical protein
VLRVPNDSQRDLYGACPRVKTQIGNIEVDQNFFVQNVGTYPVILEQLYITTSRMETKVLDDGSHYARIRSSDGKRSIQFLIVRPDNKRNKDQLRDSPLMFDDEFQIFKIAHMVNGDPQVQMEYLYLHFLI